MVYDATSLWPPPEALIPVLSVLGAKGLWRKAGSQRGVFISARDMAHNVR